MDQVITKAVQQSKNCNMQYEVFDLGNRQIIDNPERESEMIKFIDDLGLAGQKKLIVDQDDSIIPFPRMNVTDERVWETVCPEKCKMEEYASQVIPFEILELASMVKLKGYFDIDKDIKPENSEQCRKVFGFIQIWDRPKEQIDPLLVGVIEERYKYDNTTNGYWHSGKRSNYLLARWGHELVPFAEVVAQAKRQWIEKRTADARRKIADARKQTLDAEKAIEGVEADAIDHFAGQYIPSF